MTKSSHTIKNYLVSLQEAEMPFGFTHTFSKAEHDALLSAETEKQFLIDDGVACLDKYGDMTFTLKSPGGHRHHAVNYAELCRQLQNQKGVQLYARR